MKIAVDLPGHPKILGLARRLGVEPAAALGHFASLLCWAMRYQRDGFLGDLDPVDLAIAAGWGGDGGELLAALRAVRLVDDDGTIHGWEDWQGAYLRKLERDRMAAQRRRSEHEGDLAPTSPRRRSDSTETSPPQEKRRVEKSREDKNTPPQPPPPSAPDGAGLSSGSKPNLRKSDLAGLRRFGEATGFPTWWELYSHKLDRAGAEWAWYRLTEEDRAQAVAKTRAYLERRAAAEAAGGFVPALPKPSTFLNQRRWEDEFSAAPRSGAGGAGPGSRRVDPHVGAAPAGWQWGYSQEDAERFKGHPEWELYLDVHADRLGWGGERGAWPPFEEWLGGLGQEAPAGLQADPSPGGVSAVISAAGDPS